MNKIIIYDFDVTLTPYSLPKYKILEKCGFKDGMMNLNFINLVKEKSTNEGKDLYNSLVLVYFDILKSNGFKINDENMCIGSNEVVYNDGVLEFLDMITKHGVKNYLLSSGFKNYLINISISKYFDDIFATTLNYNDELEVIGVDFLMDDLKKVNAIKDILTINNLNEKDCTNMIYIGDGLTDSYAMEYVINNGGNTIYVYNDEDDENIRIMRDKKIVSFFVKSDYSRNSELNNCVRKLCNID